MTESLITGKERDSETGLDYFFARYYASNMGRFLTPDWASAPTAVPYARFGDPQSLNLYSYVQNNPIGTADPDGHYGEYVVGTSGIGRGNPFDEPSGYITTPNGETYYYGPGADYVNSEPESKPSPGSPSLPAPSNPQPGQNLGNNKIGYVTPEAAARAALSEYNSKSISNNKEYGGFIYEDKHGRFHYTKAKEGGATSLRLDIKHSGTPRGAPIVGAYHTHGDYSIIGSNGETVRTSDPGRDCCNSDHFSPEDKGNVFDMSIGRPTFMGYLGTPSGAFLTFNPRTQKEGTLP